MQTAKSHNPKIEALLSGYMRFARKFRVFVILFWCICAAIGAWLSASHLGINTDTSDMIDARVPYRVAQAEFEEAFPDINNQILVIIRAPTPDGLSIFSAAMSEALRKSELTKAVSHPPSDPFFEKNGLLYLETQALEDQLAQLTEAAPLIERLTLSPKIETLFETLAQMAERDKLPETAEPLWRAVAETLKANQDGRSQPFSWQKAFSAEGEEIYQTVIVIDPVLDHSRIRPAAPIQELIDKLGKENLELTQIDAQLHVTGNPVLRSDELKSVSQGIGLAFGISFIIVGIILTLALRSPLLVGCVLLSLILSIVMTAGLAALIFGELNLVSVAFTVLMVGLGVDFAIHLLMHLQSKRRAGLSVPAAFHQTSRGIGTALVLTAPSTALAFLAFVPTKFVGISQLGVVAAIGVSIAFLVATSLLPAIFSFLPATNGEAKKVSQGKMPSLSSTLRNRMAIGLIGLGLCALALMPQARFDADPMALRDQSAPSVEAFELLFEQSETVPYRLNVLAQDPQTAQNLSAEITQLESVKSTRSLLDFIPKDQFDKLDLIDYAAIGLEFALSGEGTPPSPREDITSELRNLLAQTESEAGRELGQTLQSWQEGLAADPSLKSRTERDLFVYWPHQLERLRAQITPSEVDEEGLPQDLKARYQSITGQSRLEILPAQDLRNPENRRRFITDVTEIIPSVTGSARSVQDAGDIIQTSMLQAVITALLTVSILLFWVTRNVRLVLIMLTPLLLAGVLTTATGVLFNLPYNFANVIVLPLLIGIGVDSSLHIALSASKAGGSGAQPPSIFDNVTPRAVIFSAVTTIASFGSLSFSAHRGTSSMGLLLMIAIAWVLLCTLCVTPALLQWTSQKRDVT